MTPQEKEIRDAYRTLFLDNPTGRLVLDDMLRQLKFFDTLDPENFEEVTLHNYAKTLLAKLSVLTDDTTHEFTQALVRAGRSTRDFIRNLARIFPRQAPTTMPDRATILNTTEVR